MQWAGDGAEIVQAFEEAGFQTEWDGMKETTVIVFDEVDPTFHGREVVCPECGEVESECMCDEMCSDCGAHYRDCICHEVCDGCGENLDDCACGEEG